jgi:hypothetical protein
MADVSVTFGQQFTANEDLVCVIRAKAELLELLYSEWSRIAALNSAVAGNRNATNNELVTADWLNIGLEKLKIKLTKVIEKVVSALSKYADEIVKPTYARIERRFNTRANIFSGLVKPELKPKPNRPLADKTDNPQHYLIPDHVQQIRKNFSWLQEKLEASSVARELFARDQITKGEMELVQLHQGSMTKAAEILLKILLEKPRPVFDAFRAALTETNQDDIYLILCGIGELFIIISTKPVDD